MARLLKLTGLTLLILMAVLGGLVVSYSVPDQSVESLKSKWAQPPSQFLEIAGMQIHLRDEGPKDDPSPIVLIHGTSASLHTWDGWSQALKDQRRVIRFDLPAFGLTGPDPKNNYTIERYAEVVIAVLDALNVEKAILVGNSLGGYIAWATTVLHPQRVVKLALVDSSGYPFKAKSMPIGFKLAMTPVIRDLIKDVLPRSLVEKSIKSVYGNPDLVSQELVSRYFDLTTREGNRNALVERFTQTKPGAMASRVPEINIPTLIMWGAKDELIPPELAENFRKNIKGSQVIMFDELGHVPHEENPQITVAAFKEFIK